MDDRSASIEQRPQEHARAVREATEDVKRQRRGRSVAEAELLMTDALRRRGIFLHPAMIRMAAVSAVDPWRWLKHPLRHLRESRAAVNAPDAESARCVAEADDVSRRISEVLEQMHPLAAREWSIDARRTVDGMEYEVHLHPYTESLAARIRAAVPPVQVTVKPR